MIVCERIRMKLLKQLMVQINMRVALSTKSKTHYETLGIRPNATHNEIKSAYYKLTLKYHPDKNKSESAKQMFQEISDAYNVLGNYQSRKQYDRTVAVKHGRVSVVYKPIYRPTEAEVDKNSKFKVYDFDEWTRQHYMKTLEINQRKKQLKEFYGTSKYKPMKDDETDSLYYVLLILFCGFWWSLIYIKSNTNYDKPPTDKTEK